MLSLRSSHRLMVNLKTSHSMLGNEVLFSQLSKVMTSGCNTWTFKYFSWKSARDHPAQPPTRWLGNSSGSSGVTLFLCFWFWEEIQPEAGRISSNPIEMNSIAYQTLTWEGTCSCNDSREIRTFLFLVGPQKSYQRYLKCRDCHERWYVKDLAVILKITKLAGRC